MDGLDHLDANLPIWNELLVQNVSGRLSVRAKLGPKQSDLVLSEQRKQVVYIGVPLENTPLQTDQLSMTVVILFFLLNVIMVFGYYGSSSSCL